VRLINFFELFAGIDGIGLRASSSVPRKQCGSRHIACSIPTIAVPFISNQIFEIPTHECINECSLLDATDLGSPEFDQVVSRFQLILLDDEARGVRNGGEPATAFAELIQRLYVCETVAFEYCKVVEGK
jgi:hypothetical protein